MNSAICSLIKGLSLTLTILLSLVSISDLLCQIEVSEEVIAFDDFNDNKNLLEVELNYSGIIQSNLLDPFSDFQDIFGITDGKTTLANSAFDQPAANILIDRAVDSSCQSFLSTDDFGVIACNYGNNFFGISDVINNQNADEVTARWKFNVEGYQRISQICIDMGAMGNFEQSDQWEIIYRLDGDENVMWRLHVDEDISHLYDITNPNVLDDPLTIDGQILSNGFSTFCFELPSKSRGNTLEIILKGSMNGSDEAIAIDNIRILGFEVEQVEGPAPNCMERLNVSLDTSSDIVLKASEFISNFDLNPEMVVKVDVFDDFKNKLASDLLNKNKLLIIEDVCEIVGEELIYHATTDSGTCQGKIFFDTKKSISLSSNSIQRDFWLHGFCSIENLHDTDLNWYQTTYPYTMKPSIRRSCSNGLPKIDYDQLGDLNKDMMVDYTDSLIMVRSVLYPIESQYNLQYTDWVEFNDCKSSDTLKKVYRKWEAQDHGKLISLIDTFVIFSLPMISDDRILCPPVDSIFSSKKELVKSELTTELICWTSFLPFHSDYNFIRYPKQLLDSICKLVSKTSVDVRIRQYLQDYPLVKGEHEEINACRLLQNSVVQGDYYLYQYEIGDSFLSDNGHYVVVDSSWFYTAGNQNQGINICIPFADLKDSVYTENSWDSSNCIRSASIIIPSSPNSSTLDTVCLEEISAGQCYQLIKSGKDSIQNCSRTELREMDLFDDCNKKALVSCSQLRVYIDTIAPLIYTDSVFQTVTTAHSCNADFYWPMIEAEDCHSEIKEVKATIYDVGSINYRQDTSNSLLWMPIEKTKISISAFEDNYLEIEVKDKCDNEAMERVAIKIEDNHPPNVALSDKRLSVHQELEWVDAHIFKPETSDNCKLNQLLIRRVDWKDMLNTNCLEGFEGANHVDKKISRTNLLTTVEQAFDDEQIATQYSNYLRSLLSSGQKIDDLVLESWIQDLNTYISDICNTEANDTEVEKNVIDQQLIKGGWATQVPIICKDACQRIEVELLVVDEKGNYVVSNSSIMPTIQTRTRVLQELESIQINCQTVFDQQYDALIKSAISFGNSQNGIFGAVLYSLLDEEFGRYAFVNQSEERYIDFLGNQLDSTFEYEFLNCSSDQSAMYEVRKFNQGFLNSNCYIANAVQRIADHRNDCGHGNLIREWTITSACEWLTDTLIVSQTIEVMPACALTINSLQNIADTTICDTFSQNLYRNIEEPKWDNSISECHSIGLEFEDEIYYLSDQSVHIDRHIKISDWCTLEDTSLSQHIIFDSGCKGQESSANRQVNRSVETSTSDSKIEGLIMNSDFLEFESNHPEEIRVEIYNLLGQAITGFSFDALKGNNKLYFKNINGLHEGCYLVRLSGRFFAYAERVVFFTEN